MVADSEPVPASPPDDQAYGELVRHLSGPDEMSELDAALMEILGDRRRAELVDDGFDRDEMWRTIAERLPPSAD